MRRQPAEAVIAVRQKIVHGSVSMVDMALRELTDKRQAHKTSELRASRCAGFGCGQVTQAAGQSSTKQRKILCGAGIA